MSYGMLLAPSLHSQGQGWEKLNLEQVLHPHHKIKGIKLTPEQLNADSSTPQGVAGGAPAAVESQRGETQGDLQKINVSSQRLQGGQVGCNPKYPPAAVGGLFHPKGSRTGTVGVE